jgi:hypothetical protein
MRLQNTVKSRTLQTYLYIGINEFKMFRKCGKVEIYGNDTNISKLDSKEIRSRSNSGNAC